MVDEAAALEAKASDYPHDRNEILIEAAAARRSDDRPERVRGLLAEEIATGGDVAGHARFEDASQRNWPVQQAFPSDVLSV